MLPDGLRVLVRGGGDLGSGIVYRLHKIGATVLVCELANPLVVRRFVSYAQAVFDGVAEIEDTTAQLVESAYEAEKAILEGMIPVIVDAELQSISWFKPDVLVDSRLLKCETVNPFNDLQVVGLGPGFTVGKNCSAAIETRRGPRLGRVLWNGSTEKDTGIPETVLGHTLDRVLRSPGTGSFVAQANIGDIVQQGQCLGTVNNLDVCAPFEGIVRGLIANGVSVETGWKIGDIDPRMDPSLAFIISDKALAIGGAVLEAILSNPENRKKLALNK
jgi:xanthine dehydrogenase accessory factor